MAPYFSIFGKEIPMYGIFFYIGLFVAVAVALFICKYKKIPRYEIAYSGVYTMIGAIIGAKLLFIIVSLPTIIEQDLSLEAIIKGGFVFYGGFIGGVLGLIIYAKQFHMPLMPFAEIYATVLPLGHAFGRVGCFFAGCCYGMPYDGPFSHTYEVSIGNTPIGIPLFPVQLLESLGLLIIFAILMTVYFKTKEKYGYSVTVYLIAYPILRFIAELFRGDSERGHILILSVSQWISLLVFIAGVLCLIRLIKTNRTAKADE